MVFRATPFSPHYNVFDNVAYGLKLRHVPKGRDPRARDEDP